MLSKTKSSINVTESVSAIEEAKIKVLKSVFTTFEALLYSGNIDNTDKVKLISDIIMNSYELANTINVKYEEVDKKIVDTLKAKIAKSDEQYSKEALLLKHIRNGRI